MAMNLLYNPHDHLDLTDFGIQIPISKDNAAHTIENLLAQGSSAQPPTWLISNLPPGPTKEDLLRVHTPRYVQSLFAGGASLEAELMRAFELVLPDGSYHRYDPSTANRPLGELFDILLARGGGTYGAGLYALEEGAAFYLGGGFHHGQADFGSGFCVFNDVVTATRKLQVERKVTSVWIVDVDAHKGDGTAALTVDDPTIVTLSIHMAEGWPLDISIEEARTTPGRTELSFLPSTLDLGIPPQIDGKYCGNLGESLDSLWNNRIGGSLNTGFVFDALGNRRPVPHPDLVYILMGADPFEEDELPSARFLALDRHQMHQRDQLVHKFFQERLVPTAYVMAGSYGENGWKVYTDFLTWALAY
ncbi:MAG: histone deacetylase [Spirochaetales bacterium]|nr:histone deacetylase [Spirochaetales bacterium]